MTKRCSRKDCIAPAACQVAWRAWALGYPKSSAPIKAVLDLYLCRGHLAEVTVKDFISAENSLRINAMLKRDGKQPIDPESAELILLPVGNKEMPGHPPAAA